MKPEASLEEVELVKSLGVETRCGIEVGKDVTREELEREFDAIFLGTGLGAGQPLRIPGEDLPEVVDALTFIEQIHTAPLHQTPLGARGLSAGGFDKAVQVDPSFLHAIGVVEVYPIFERGNSIGNFRKVIPTRNLLRREIERRVVGCESSDKSLAKPIP